MGTSLQQAIQAPAAGREQLAPTNIHFPCVLTTPEPPDLLTRLLSSWSSVSWEPVLSGALDRFLHSHVLRVWAWGGHQGADGTLAHHVWLLLHPEVRLLGRVRPGAQ